MFDLLELENDSCNCIIKFGEFLLLLFSKSILVATNISAWSSEKNVSEDAYVDSHKTHRFTTVEEIASMALYLSSDMASNIIGQIIAIDGGWALK